MTKNRECRISKPITPADSPHRGGACHHRRREEELQRRAEEAAANATDEGEAAAAAALAEEAALQAMQTRLNQASALWKSGQFEPAMSLLAQLVRDLN